MRGFRADVVEQQVGPQALLSAYTATHRVDGLVRISYTDRIATRASLRLPILLIHGSPGRKEDLDGLARILSRDARVIVPDLPGFGTSTRDIPDYSFRAHARYIDALLERLDIPRVHVVAHSMGGGVALNLVDIAPERVASLSMVSAVGVQEMELTGNFALNHLVHGLQLGGLWLIAEATPHMGLLGAVPLNVAYARNFFDSDQRPLRAVLQRAEMPALIVHGRDDSLVPVEAAYEHARLLPQSELVTVPGGHMLVFSTPAAVAQAVNAFLVRVESGGALRRADADATRRLAAAQPFDSRRLPQLRGVAAAVFGGLVAVGAAIFGDLAFAVAGVCVALGRVSPALAAFACAAGVALRSWFSPRPVGERWRSRHVAVRAGRALLVALASTVTAWLVLRTAGSQWRQSWLGCAALCAATFLVVTLAERVSTFRGRRLLLSTWRRTTRWEFWPPWLFYPPVAACIAWLMIKHRSLTLFTASNPSIPASGVVGESKADILRGLSGARGAVARFVLIPGGLTSSEKSARASQFMTAQGVGFPVVLKPNHGQRGSGVVIVRTLDALADALDRSPTDTILQEYISGDEFGIFYYRLPSEPSGHVFSITQKTFPTVRGDGVSTLERLILSDDRAVCAARLYCERYYERLGEVLPAGHVFPLAELGSHCRGAVFLDGASLWTEALEQKIDAVARSFSGFYFGRFDVRVPGGADALRLGEGIRVLELNGVTSEATHIYHPGTPLLSAYRVLARQWRLAFAIGEENRTRGVRPVRLRELLMMAVAYRREARGHLAERLKGA
ncbi:MAG: alpha/beta fold hydrolase [Vicinamibacterales bacterium]